ncbi:MULTISPECIES: TonB-dependent receptor [Sphingomonadaceae]|uniref:TonB-dependent receptor n=1 Tax=Sphingomonadales TaxID=204457 RepID=UPI00076FFE7E|nr:TonB-dependent receptor [Sphingobium sp. TKS]AMK23163.1 TonB-dependent siderophore receptor [Sphingobium sp. TKS]MCF8707601.1 TonB-dependent receptor [Rhizorhapis sp. SPR117]
MPFRSQLFVTAGALVLLPTSAACAAEQDGGTLDEIVVTAEKSNRSLRETASSVTVITDEAAERMGVYGTNELLDRMTNLVNIKPGNAAPTVRGIDGTGPAQGSDAFFAGTRPRLNYQLDGRTLGFNESIFQNGTLWDIGQVEVYRGPQSTLQGRNAIAGTIAIRTADPTFDWEGRARALVGSQDERQVSGALSGPIAPDLLAFRLSADWRRSQAYVDFTPYPEEAHPGRFQNLTLRGKLLFTPTPDVRSLLTVAYVDGRAPQSEYVLGPDYSQKVPQSAPQPVFRSRNTTGITDTSWRVSDIVTLQAYLSATDFRTDRYAPATTGNARIDGREYVAEPFVRLRSPDDRFSGFVAAYIFRTHQSETIDLYGGGAFRDRTRTTAAFGEFTGKLTDALTLVLGGRYEVEHRFRTGYAGPFLIDFDETYREFLPKATLSLRATDAITVGVTAGRGYNGGGAGFTYYPPYVSYTYKPEFVWNYEGFLRSSLAGGKVTLTANVFYNDYKGLQLPYSLGVLSTVIRNADRATTYGAEAGISWNPSMGNQIYANVGLLKTRVNRYDDPAVQGNDLLHAPAFSSDVGFNVSPDGKFEMGGDVRYTDSYFSDVFSNARGKVSPYAVLNGRVAYNLGPARLSLSVRNLLNSGHPVDYVIYGGAVYGATILQPRTVTGGVELRF